MKYDTGMTHLHGDVLAAVRLMLYHNTEINKKFNPAVGSPAPLREYLKSQYNKSGKVSDGVQYDCKSTGMDINLKRPLNNEGDRHLQLSWSQLVVFIRNNWDEVFRKESEFPSESDVSDDNEEELDDVDITKDGPALKVLAASFLDSKIKCPNFHNGGECKTVTLTMDGRVGGLNFKCSECIMSFCEEDKAAKWLANCVGYPEGCVYYRKSQEGKATKNEQESEENSIMTTAITEKQIKAAELNRRIITAAQLAQQSLYEMCMGFKEMRDSKLYKELGYSDFGDYCEKETGFKRSQAYNYISIVEKLPADFVQRVGQIPMRDLLFLTTVSEQERAEIVDNTDLENTTVKQLEQQIKTLRAEKDKAVAEKSAAEAQTAAKDDTISALERTNKELDERIISLQGEVKALENRPIETAVEYVEKIPDDYVTKKAYEDMVKTYTDQLDEANEENLTEKRRAFAEKTELEKKLAEVEKQLKEAKADAADKTADPDTDEVYKVYMAKAYSSLNKLVEYVQEHKEYVPKVTALVDNIKKSLEA